MHSIIKLVLLFEILFCINQRVKAQSEELKVDLYETSMDFLEEKKSVSNAKATLKKEQNYIKIKNLIDPITNEKIRRWRSYWAVDYTGNKYFNLGYSSDLNLWNTYIKFDIIGRYCTIIVDEDLKRHIKRSGGNYGGLVGVLINDSYKWEKKWVDKDGNKIMLLFIDTSEIEPKFLDRNQSSIGNLLTKDKFADITKDNYLDLNLKEISFEKVTQIIRELNESSMKK